MRIQIPALYKIICGGCCGWGFQLLIANTLGWAGLLKIIIFGPQRRRQLRRQSGNRMYKEPLTSGKLSQIYKNIYLCLHLYIYTYTYLWTCMYAYTCLHILWKKEEIVENIFQRNGILNLEIQTEKRRKLFVSSLWWL